jgi:hypothetical protein
MSFLLCLSARRQGLVRGVREATCWPLPCPSGRSTPTVRSPHRHLDSVLAERHADSGPSTTVLCPHSSHKRTPLPGEEPFTCSSPAPSRRLRPTRRTRGGCATLASLRAAVHFPTWLGAYLPSATARKVKVPRPARQLELLVGRKFAYTSTSIRGEAMPTVDWIGLFMGSHRVRSFTSDRTLKRF